MKKYTLSIIFFCLFIGSFFLSEKEQQQKQENKDSQSQVMRESKAVEQGNIIEICHDL